MRKITLATILIMLTASLLSAQGLTMGNDLVAPNESDDSIAVTRTDIDLASPANATGNLTSVWYYYAFSCPNAVKIKVFRRVGDTFTLVAERGPYTTTNGDNTVAITPPVAVKQGDLIGLSKISNCGYAGTMRPGWQNNYLAIAGEPTSFTLAQATKVNATLALKGTGNAVESIVGVIPAVASNSGIGAYYRTSLQMMAHPPVGSTPMTGKLVFHPLGTPGGPADVTLPFSIMPGDMQSWDDILTSVGITNKSASVDVVVPWNHALPVVTTHLFNDKGVDGTEGFRQDVVDLNRDKSQVFTAGMWGYLLGPIDATRYRCNIGARSLEEGVEGTIEVRRDNGTVLGTKSFRYGPNTYDQKSFKSFTGVDLQDRLYVRIMVSTGTAIFYASVADNKTGDPANVLARIYEGIL